MQVFYKPNLGYITVHISPYHAWQGLLGDMPLGLYRKVVSMGYLDGTLNNK